VSAAVATRRVEVAPFDWASWRTWLAARAVDGLEEVDGDVYRRAIAHGGSAGVVQIAWDGALVATIGLDDADGVLARVRRMFDADTDLAPITAHLSRDPALAGMIAARPAVRVIGGWGGFEIGCRAILGQQVTIAGARTLVTRLVQRSGARLDRPVGALHALFPTPEQVLAADLSDMGMPGARAVALKSLAQAVIADPALFDGGGPIEHTVARLTAIRGIGEWTAHYVAMRACRDPDAFPASDVGLLRGAADASGERPTPAALRERAEAWRPFRAYAAQHLWAADAARLEAGR